MEILDKKGSNFLQTLDFLEEILPIQTLDLRKVFKTCDLDFLSLQKSVFSGLSVLMVKYRFPGSFLPQRVRINLRLLSNDVFQVIKLIRSSVFQEWTCWSFGHQVRILGLVLPQRVRLHFILV